MTEEEKYVMENEKIIIEWFNEIYKSSKETKDLISDSDIVTELSYGIILLILINSTKIKNNVKVHYNAKVNNYI
jgi:hypothetical protein